VSVNDYTRLERGNLTGVSASVLEALGRVVGDHQSRTVI